MSEEAMLEETLLEEPAPSQTAAVQPKKKLNTKLLIGIGAAAVVVIAAAIIIAVILSSSGKDSNAYVYFSDGKYELITNLDKDTTVEIDSSKADSARENLLAFSPDGKYVYYYTKYDSYSGTGTLCRAEYSKLREDSDKNEKYIEVIDKKVKLGFRFMENGAVTYLDEENTLYYYDGKEATKVDKSVSQYTTDSTGRIVYETGNYSDGYALYGVTVEDLDNSNKLASNYLHCYDIYSFDNIFFTKSNENGGSSLYVTGFDKEPEKLADDVTVLEAFGGTAYYITNSDKTLSLYNYVEDPHADSDAAIAEPNVDDYSVPRYNYSMVYGSDLSESDYDELYTSCTRDLYWFGQSTWWSYSMEEAVDMDWGEKTEGIRTATQNFIDRFGNTADEDGYILVTDEVKAALQEIQKYAAYPEREWEWMWLCYNKYQSGTTVDYDKYYAAYDEYNMARSRQSTREMLKSEEYNVPVWNLYCYNNGTQTLISDSMLHYNNYGSSILYNTADLITETVPLENVYSTWDVQSLLDLDYKDENYVIGTGETTPYRMSAQAAAKMAEVYENEYEVSLYITDSTAFLDGRRSLMTAAVSNGVVGEFTSVADDANVLVSGSTLYYTSNFQTENGRTYCDLYSYTQGKSTCLAEGILTDTRIYIYGDNAILAYTDYQNGSGYELTMFAADGTSTRIADDVTQFIRVDESTILFISDGDLYCHNGEDKDRLRKDAQWIWSKNKMPVTLSLYSSNYYDYYE